MPKAVMKDATSLRPVEASPRVATPVDTPVVDTPPAEPKELIAVDVSTGEIQSPGDVQAVLTQLIAKQQPVVRSGLGTREEIQDELDTIAASVREFHLKQPDQIMRECAAYTARLTELCVLLHRVESLDRQYTRVRTQQVERWLTELERQFKYASRLVELMRQDLSMSGAMT